MSDTQVQEEGFPDQLTTLKARADLLKISYHPSIGVEKLREKIAEVMNAAPPAAAAVAAPVEAPVAAAEPEVETPAQEKQRLKRYAHELVRIRVTCMNPAKKDWEGEIFTVGNSLVGSITKYIPFNADAGWHVPRILLHVMQDRQCQVFSPSGAGKLIKEFGIEILDPLTAEELKDLAQRQALAQSID